jgi:hypothetical protein
MIVVRVELHSAIDGSVRELARAHISNAGGTTERCDYDVVTLRGRSKEALDKRVGNRRGKVRDYPRLAIHVWHLVAAALQAIGYSNPRSGDTGEGLTADEARLL